MIADEEKPDTEKVPDTVDATVVTEASSEDVSKSANKKQMPSPGESVCWITLLKGYSTQKRLPSIVFQCIPPPHFPRDS